MATTVLRKEIQGYISKIPDRNLAALKPLLSVLAEPCYTIEPASPAECKKIEKRIKEYHENPSSFVPWKEVKRKLKKTGMPDVEGESVKNLQ